MLKKSQKNIMAVGRVGVIALSGLFSSAAVAGNGGTIVFGPDSIGVPVLSGPMVIVISALFAVIGYRVLRAGGSMNRVAGVAVLGAGVLVGSIAGIGHVRSSGLISPPEGECNTGGELHFDLFAFTTFENSCPNDLRIKRIDRECPEVIVVLPQNGARAAYPKCNVGDVVEASGGCVISACPSPPDEV